MSLLFNIPLFISLVFIICYFYQLVYMPIAILKKDRPLKEPVPHRFAILISARNEKNVLGDLLDSIRAQTYPQELMQVFVIADNCTDNTAEIARAHGAVVYERFNKEQIGKGYALDALLGHIREDYPDAFDGYIVFDADNILMSDFVERMNETISSGYEIVTSYRNSKNFGANWISGSCALMYLRECQILNRARMKIGTSSSVQGTGYYFSHAVMERNNGWPFYLLTEDAEFTFESILQDYAIGYCEKAELFDEQPVTFKQSWTQRSRWVRGYVQVLKKYTIRLFGKILRGSFSALDMFLTIAPAAILTGAMLLVVLIRFVICLIYNLGLGKYGLTLLELLVAVTGLLFMIGLIITISEWDKIHTTTAKKIKAVFAFPIFMLTFIPVTVHALIAKPEWKPIEHTFTAADLLAETPGLQVGAKKEQTEETETVSADS